MAHVLINLNCLLKLILQGLSTKNLSQSHERTGNLYLIGYVVRQGSMTAKEVDPRRQSMPSLLPVKKPSLEYIRR